MPPGAEQLEAIDRHDERILEEARLYYMLRTMEEDRRRSEEFNRKMERLGLLGMMEEQKMKDREMYSEWMRGGEKKAQKKDGRGRRILAWIWDGLVGFRNHL